MHTEVGKTNFLVLNISKCQDSNILKLGGGGALASSSDMHVHAEQGIQ